MGDRKSKILVNGRLEIEGWFGQRTKGRQMIVMVWDGMAALTMVVLELGTYMVVG